MKITDFHFDLLKIIMVFLAKSSDGATDLARAKSVCKIFTNLANDMDVLRAVNFERVRLSVRYYLFHHINGILSRCAQAGNDTAKYLLAKAILVSYSRLLPIRLQYSVRQCSVSRSTVDQPSCSAISERRANPSSVAISMAHQARLRNASHGSLLHSELVRLFLCRCGPEDLVEMRPHLAIYLYSVGFRGRKLGFLEDYIDKMCTYNGIFQFLEKLQNDNMNWRCKFRNLAGILGEPGGEVLIVETSGALYGYRVDGFKKTSIRVAAGFESCRTNAISVFDQFFTPT